MEQPPITEILISTIIARQDKYNFEGIVSRYELFQNVPESVPLSPPLCHDIKIYFLQENKQLTGGALQRPRRQSVLSSAQI